MVALPDEHVVRLDVAVHEPGGVGGVQRVGHLAEQVDRPARVELVLAEDLDERRAVDQSHGEVGPVLGLARLVHGHHVRMLECGLGASLGPEAARHPARSRRAAAP